MMTVLLLLQVATTHEWTHVTNGTMIAARLVVDRAFLKDDLEKFALVIGCSVATATPTLTAGLLTTGIGVDIRQPVQFGIDGERRQIPVTRSGLTPQNATIAPGFVASMAKSLSTATNVQITFTDAFGQQRDWTLAVSNGSKLAAMLAPCGF